MRAARLLSILLQLQVHGRLTAAELAQQLEVSERTIYRDMDELSAAGIPVVAERGVGGGWYLLDEYRTHLTGLHEEEIRTLFLSHSAQRLTELGLQSAADQALLKLMAALPTRQRRSADDVRQRIHIDDRSWHASDGDTLTWLPRLQTVIWEDRKAEITYQRGDGEVVTRIVDPLGLVAKGKIWYLVAGVDGDYRTYRIARIQHVRPLAQACSRPDGFDLAEHWEMSTAHFVAQLPRYRFTLRMRTEQADWLISLWRYMTVESKEPADDHGWQIVHLCTETEDEAAVYVRGCGSLATVVDPLSLRQRFESSL